MNSQLKRNLLLTLDWNLPDLALSEIFQRDDDMKYSIPAELFDKAILGKKLEPFVDLFLDRDFVLHRYLKSDKLVSLFDEAKDREFLTTTSLEGILGLTGVMIYSIYFSFIELISFSSNRMKTRCPINSSKTVSIELSNG